MWLIRLQIEAQSLVCRKDDKSCFFFLTGLQVASWRQDLLTRRTCLKRWPNCRGYMVEEISPSSLKSNSQVSLGLYCFTLCTLCFVSCAKYFLSLLSMIDKCVTLSGWNTSHLQFHADILLKNNIEINVYSCQYHTLCHCYLMSKGFEGWSDPDISLNCFSPNW